MFKGKGYRVKKFKRITYHLFFGHSHVTKLHFYSKNFKFLKRRRQLHNFLCLNRLEYRCFSLCLPNIKLINRYTKRGLRFKKQFIKKRFGKISQHISIMH